MRYYLVLCYHIHVFFSYIYIHKDLYIQNVLTSAHIHKNVLQETGFFLHNIHSEYNFHKEKTILESNDSVLISLFTAKKKKGIN